MCCVYAIINLSDREKWLEKTKSCKYKKIKEYMSISKKETEKRLALLQNR